jgi:hypothetical protein
MGPTSEVYVSDFIPSLQETCKMNVKLEKGCTISRLVSDRSILKDVYVERLERI